MLFNRITHHRKWTRQHRSAENCLHEAGIPFPKKSAL